MKSLVKRIVICVIATLVVCGVIAGIIIYNNPVYYTNTMMRLGRYPSVVSYYNKSDIKDKDKETVDAIIKGKIETAYEAWSAYLITYDEAERILEPFLEIDDASIRESVESHLSVMKTENTGNESLAKAEEYFGDNDFLQAMKCREEVVESYSKYQSLQDIYDESREILLNKIGTPSTEEEYKEAIKTLEGYISVVDDEENIKKKDTLENELTEYKDVHEIIQNATEAYENGKYKKSFSILEKGGKKYPDSNKIKYATSSYQFAYILTVTGEVEVLLEDEDYEGAIELLEGAIENYDCEQFQDLLDSVKRKDSWLYNIGATLSDAGDYVFKSAKKIVLGDFDEDEEETLLSLGGNIAASVAGVDAPLDARDLAYDISHWGEGDYFAARFALDVVGVIPFIGAVKVLKHADTVADIAKAADKGAEVADAAHDIANAADTAHDIANAADAAHDVSNVADTVHDAANAADTAHDIVNAADATEDIGKQIDEVVDEVIEDVTKKADVVPDLADDFTDVTKAVDKAEDVADAAQTITKKGGSYGEVFVPGEGDLFEVHHMPADSVSDLSRKEGPAIKMSKEDHRLTASCGSSLEAMQYKEMQKELIENGHFLDAVQMDIDDIHDKFGDKYDDAIDEMLDYVNQLIKEGKISG